MFIIEKICVPDVNTTTYSITTNWLFKITMSKHIVYIVYSIEISKNEIS